MIYVFLCETSITIDGEVIELSPLSYISVNYQGEIYYYNKKNVLVLNILFLYKF